MILYREMALPNLFYFSRNYDPVANCSFTLTISANILQIEGWKSGLIAF